MSNNPITTCQRLASTLLLLATVANNNNASASSVAVDDKTANFQQIAAAAASYLRKNDADDRISADTTDLPYFGGQSGTECVKDAVERWKKEGGPVYESLLAIMDSERYKLAAARCAPEIAAYDRAAALVCLLEKESDNDMTYAKFWANEDSDVNGYQYYDGAIDLATMFSYTGNFTTTGLMADCGIDCYTGQGDGCEEFHWLKFYGQVPLEQVCNEQWHAIDSAYLVLRTCASMAIGDPVPEMGGDITKEVYVNEFIRRQLSAETCAFKYCTGGEL